MRLLIVILLLAIPAAVLAHKPLKYRPSGVTEITDCLAAGTDNAAITHGKYEVCAHDEDTWVCKGATCNTGGMRIPSGECKLWEVEGATYYCRSASAGGDLQFTPVG